MANEHRTRKLLSISMRLARHVATRAKSSLFIVSRRYKFRIYMSLIPYLVGNSEWIYDKLNLTFVSPRASKSVYRATRTAERFRVLFESFLIFFSLAFLFLRPPRRLLRTVVLFERASVRHVPAAAPDCATRVVPRTFFACFGLPTTSDAARTRLPLPRNRRRSSFEERSPWWPLVSLLDFLWLY